MAFNSTIFREQSKIFAFPTSYYKNYIQSQSKDHSYRQVLHESSCLALLNKSQLQAYNTITKALDSGGQKIFCLVGEGGSGKTTLLKSVCNHIHQSKQLYIATAITGVASSNIYSMTVYSLLGWVNPKLPYESLITAPYLPHVKNRLASMSTLLLDEIGLVGSRTLGCISRRMSHILGDPTPFAAKHVIMCGDFGQV